MLGNRAFGARQGINWGLIAALVFDVAVWALIVLAVLAFT